MKIIEHREPPVGLLELAEEVLGGVGCETLIIGAYLDFMTEGRMSVLVLEKKCVVIDLASCGTDVRWMRRGAFYVPNVWFNLVYCIFHEAAHLYQIEEYGDEIHDVPEAILEHSADLIAMDSLAEWIQETNNIVPSLDDFGWLQGMIRNTLNYLYASGLPVELELDAMKMDAVARALAVKGLKETDSQALAALRPDRDKGLVVGVGDEVCLTTYGFLTIANEPFTKEEVAAC